MGRKTTNEWEFQGEVLSWINAELASRPGMGLEKATQEPSKITRHRSDLVIWFDRATESAFLNIEIKTPETALTDLQTFRDAQEKARRWQSKFFLIWNMQAAELYPTPQQGTSVTRADRLELWPLDASISRIDDWLKSVPRESLKKRAVEMLDRAWFLQYTTQALIPIDAAIFVDRLANRLITLRRHLTQSLKMRARADKRIRRQIRALSAQQGFLGFVDDTDEAIAGQYAYRIIGQILFYFALRRKQPSLSELSAADGEVPRAFRPYWDDVRRFDYEALFGPSELESLVPIPEPGQEAIRKLVEDLKAYDWNSVYDDVLGAIFEKLIPKNEQILLGQFYTPTKVADLIIASTVGAKDSVVLDPGCGSGTFLMRTYHYLKSSAGAAHRDLLSRLWGFDISPFATELAVINLFRQDMREFDNFPRVLPGDFFSRSVGETIQFTPARAGEASEVSLQVPGFDAVIGNPPYLRSQQQDDLDDNYKARLFAAAHRENVMAAKKTDLFAFFIYQSLVFLRPGGMLGFVTSASWLTAEFAVALQRLLLERFRLLTVISSQKEAFFSQVAVNTVLVIAELRSKGDTIGAEELIRFVCLKKRLEDLFPDDAGYWRRILDFMDEVESLRQSCETDAFRLVAVPAGKEYEALLAQGRTRNWSKFVRAPTAYFELFGDEGEPA